MRRRSSRPPSIAGRAPAFGAAFAIALVATFAALAGSAAGQCILANPSFELGGQGGAVFGGWDQFGAVGSVTTASHGARAARVSGLNDGSWNVSGFWQRLDSEPGERWEARGHVQHPPATPLAGASVALVNIEWRDAAGLLIDFDSFTVAGADTPPGAYQEFSVLSAPAPPGTVAIHVLLGVLQGPGDPPCAVYYDQVTVHSTSEPTIDDLQWADFPGGRTLDFAGRTWRVKGPGFYGPGPNIFCDQPECVWVDHQDRLHLTLADQGGGWASTEVALEEALGYGDYILTTEGRLDLLDPQSVLGIFLWQYGPCWDEAYFWWNPYNEIDIEYSRWSDPGNEIAQFVAQPYDYPGNLERFEVVFADGEVVSHAMRWLADRVEYRVWRGGPADESAATMVRAWTYTGPHVPRPEQPRLHLNLWRFGDPPAGPQEVVFRDFVFVPEGGVTAVGGGPDSATPPATAGRILTVAPSPFNPQTTINFELDRSGAASLEVFDLAGRRLRTLAAGRLAAGTHQRTWDGRDDHGRAVASGIYLIRLRGSDFVETRRVVLAR